MVDPVTTGAAVVLVIGGLAGWLYNQSQIQQLKKQQEKQQVVNLTLFLINIVVLLVVIDIGVLVYFLNNNTPSDFYTTLFRRCVEWIFYFEPRKSWDNQTVLIIALGILLIELLIIGLIAICKIGRGNAVVPLINMHIGDNNYCSAVFRLSVGAAAVAFFIALAVWSIYRYLPI